jgi:CRP-like cAMP-binding protein
VSDVKAAVRRHKAAQKRLDDAHQALRDRLRAARDAGVRQVDLAEMTGYTREHVRRLLLPDPQDE